MKNYKTTQITRIASGHIGLTEKQAKRRMQNLKPVKKGVFEVVSPVEFKAGETIRLKNPDKVLLSKLECLDPEKSQTKQKKEKDGENDDGQEKG